MANVLGVVFVLFVAVKAPLLLMRIVDAAHSLPALAVRVSVVTTGAFKWADSAVVMMLACVCHALVSLRVCAALCCARSPLRLVPSGA